MLDLFNPWKEFDCGDGRKVQVRKNIDKAVPLALKTKHIKLKAGAKVSDEIDGSLSASKKEIVDSLFVKINDRNASLVLDYRLAYEAFAVDPCARADDLQRVTEEILKRKNILEELEMKIEALITLSKTTPNNRDLIDQRIIEIADGLVPAATAEVAARKISNARKVAHELIEDEVS